MITVLQNKENDAFNRVIKEWHSSESSVLLCAEENGISLGYILFCIDSNDAIVTGFELSDCSDYTVMDNERLLICELLIRAVANYAVNRNALRIKSKVNNLFFAAVQLGIGVQDDCIDLSIVSLFSHKKCNEL